jgi:RimJ/RimL family protein N-acetyltransferase
MNIFLETERLILRLPSWSDLDNLVALRSDPDVMKYIGDGSTHTKAQVEGFLSFAIPYQEKYGFGFCCVFEKETGEFVGQAGLFHKGFYDEQPDIELAYRLHKKYWGRGYATELAKALICWAFENLQVDKIISAAEPENIASQKVLLKSGFLFLGQQKWREDKELFYYENYKNDAIKLSAYSEEWPQIAELEINKLYGILPRQHIIDIQHVGSTAIPGMSAKPVIDIQIAVDSLSTIKLITIKALKELGYEYWDKNPDPERLFFAKGMPPFGEKRTHHVHIVEPSSHHWREKILFRDYLRDNPEERLKY